MLETSNQHPMIGRAPPPKKKKPNNPQKIKRRTVENAKFTLGVMLNFRALQFFHRLVGLASGNYQVT